MNKSYAKHLAIISLLILGRAANAQCPVPAACTPGRATSPQAGIFGMGILNVTLETINNTTAGTADGYQDYSCQPTARLAPGAAYRISVTTNPGTNENVRVWLDYNNDGTFDPTGELFFSSNNARTHTGISRPVPATAVAGVRLRMRVAADGATAPLPTPCSAPLYSQTEDYGVVLGPPTLPPVAAFGVDGAGACMGRFGFLDQSQRSPSTWRWRFGDGTTSTLPNPTHTYATPGIYAVTLRVCNALGCDSLTQAAAVRWYPPLGVAAQCTPATASYCCNYGIASVAVGGQSQNSASAVAGYEDFTCQRRFTGTQDDVVSLRVAHTNASPYDTRVYIDYDNNGIFNEATERVFEALNTNSPAGSFRLAGGGAVNTPLRLRVLSAASGLPITACTNLVLGQAEDYGLVVTPSTCAPLRALAHLTGPLVTCAGDPATLVLPNPPTAPNVVLQWQTSPDSLAWADVPGARSATLTLAAAATAYYRVRATCGSFVRTTAARQLVASPTLCYCTQLTQVGNCRPNLNRLVRAWIPQTTLDHLARPCSRVADSTRYQLGPVPANETATFQQGGTYEFKAITTRAEMAMLWIDYNRDGSFDPNEYVPLNPTGPGPATGAALFTVPATAGLGLTGMRLRTASVPFQVDPCFLATAGDTYDYLVTLAPPSCAPPLARGRVLGRPTFCAGTPPPLSVLGQTIGTQLQWQASPDSLAWTDVAGATGRLLTGTGFRDSTYVRVRSRCGAATAYTAAVYARPDAQLCVCTPPATANNWDAALGGFRIGNTSLVNLLPQAEAYAYYPPTVPTQTATLLRGVAYPLSAIERSTFGSPQPAARAWLDYNHDGYFTDDEALLLRSDPARRDSVGTLLVPPDAPLGRLRLRVLARGFPGPLDARTQCDFLAGETRDYLVTIVAPPAAPGPPVAGTLTGPPNSCPGQRLRLTVAGFSYGAALRWETQASPGGAWAPVAGGTGTVLLTAPFATATAYRVAATANGQTAYAPALAVAVGACPCVRRLGGDNNNTLHIRGWRLRGRGAYLAAYNNRITRTPFGVNFSAYADYGLLADTLHTTVYRGHTYAAGIVVATSIGVPYYYARCAAWFDYNRNGVFEASEFQRLTPQPDAGFIGGDFVTIPRTAPLGQVAVRLRAVLGPANLSPTDACTNVYSGETEDYVLTIADEPAFEAPNVLFNGRLFDAPLAAGSSLTLTARLRDTYDSLPASATYRWVGPNGFASAAARPRLANLSSVHTGYYFLTAQLGTYQVTVARYLDMGRPTATAAARPGGAATLYPNPSPGHSTLSLSGLTGPTATVAVLNATGQVVLTRTVATPAATAALALDLAQPAPGLYLVLVRTATGTLCRKWVVE